MSEMPKATQLVDRDRIRIQLSAMEDQILKVLDGLSREPGVDQRWLAIGKTDLQKAFMCAKRALYEGKRVGDP